MKIVALQNFGVYTFTGCTDESPVCIPGMKFCPRAFEEKCQILKSSVQEFQQDNGFSVLLRHIDDLVYP